eukprot:scaffold37682_cov57-Cyclotella_meneghiniana.AAC.1
MLKTVFANNAAEQQKFYLLPASATVPRRGCVRSSRGLHDASRLRLGAPWYHPFQGCDGYDQGSSPSNAKHEKPAAKSWALCKKFGGASATHNTNDCKKWDSKGNLKKGFKGKVDMETPPGTGKSYVQLFAETEKLKAKSKKLKKAFKKKSARKKRKYEVIAVIDTSTDDPENGIEHSKRCRRTNKLLFTKKIRVLLDSGSDGDIWFHRKGATKRFPYTERQVVKAYNTSPGKFPTKGKAKFIMISEFSESKQYTIRPDIMEYDRLEWPAFDLIIGVKTMKN